MTTRRPFVQGVTAFVVALGLIATSAAPTSASATDGASAGDATDAAGAHCTATTEAQHDACRYQALADMNVSRARCFNVSEVEERDACFEETRAERVGANKLCREQREAR